MPASGLALKKGGDYLGGRYYPGKVCGSRRHRLPGIWSPPAMIMYVFQFDAIATTPSGSAPWTGGWLSTGLGKF